MRKHKKSIIILMIIAAMIVLLPNMVVTYQLGFIPDFMNQIDLNLYRELCLSSLGLWGLLLGVAILIDGIHQIKQTKRYIRWIGTMFIDLFCIGWSIIFLVVLSYNDGWEVVFMYLSMLWLFTIGLPIGMILHHLFFPHYGDSLDTIEKRR